MLTIFEHGVVAVESTAGKNRLSIAEAEAAAKIAGPLRGFCTRGYRSLRFAQYAGLVSLAGRSVEILPKVDEFESATSDCRGVLLRLLRLAEGLKLSLQDTTVHSVRDSSLLDVFVEAFFDEVFLLLRGGLLRRYRQEEEDLPLVRGRIDWARQIGTLAMRTDKVSCRFDELRADNDWNRLLKAALHALRPHLSQGRLQRRWTELWAAFDEVSVPADWRSALGRLGPDRQSDRYATAVRWAGWILSVVSPDLRAGASTAPGLLFNTAQLFERSIARHLRRAINRHESDWNLSSQESGRYLGRVEDHGAGAIAVRPDLVLRIGTDIALVADTKWKCVGVSRSGHLDPSNADVHQMLAYAMTFRCNDVALIYPWHRGLESARETVIRLPNQANQPVRLHVLCVDVGEDHLPVRLGGSTPLLGRLLGH